MFCQIGQGNGDRMAINSTPVPPGVLKVTPSATGVDFVIIPKDIPSRIALFTGLSEAIATQPGRFNSHALPTTLDGMLSIKFRVTLSLVVVHPLILVRTVQSPSDNSNFKTI